MSKSASYACPSASPPSQTRSVEGTSGTLQVYVIPQLSPKIAYRLTFLIRPLSLHERTNEVMDANR